MKGEKGITLITLIITIIVIGILAAVTLYNGQEAIAKSKLTSYQAQMQIIQAKVDLIYERRRDHITEKEYYDAIGKDITNVKVERLEPILKGSNREEFRYFDKEELRKIDIESTKMVEEVIINYDTREVYSLDGITISGTTYYSLSGLPGYTRYQTEEVNKNNKPPTFTLISEKVGINEWKISVTNIQYQSNVKGGDIYYKKKEQEHWRIASDEIFYVKEIGTYEVKLMDRANNETIHEIVI